MTTSSDQTYHPTLSKRPFGKLPDDRLVEAWTLQGKGGLQMEVLNLGGIVSQLRVPNAHSGHSDVVLGFNELAPYLDGRSAYAGSITGRIAGRVPDGKILLDGVEFQLTLNDGENHMHGGRVGLDQRIWKVCPLSRVDAAPSLKLTYTSKDGEEMYPGNVELTVVYTLMNDDSFHIQTEAVSDRPTPISLTHHGYFNLAGEGNGSIVDHELSISSDETILKTDSLSLTGNRAPVEGKSSDLKKARQLSEVIPGLFKQHGDMYWIRRPKNSFGIIKAARLYHPASGIVMEVETSQTCLQFYTGLHFNGTITGKSGQPYERFAGLCLEAEGYPAATTQKGFGDIIVRPGSPQRHSTLYRFYTACK